jgi:hypothetical protein
MIVALDIGHRNSEGRGLGFDQVTLTIHGPRRKRNPAASKSLKRLIYDAGLL